MRRFGADRALTDDALQDEGPARASVVDAASEFVRAEAAAIGVLPLLGTGSTDSRYLRVMAGTAASGFTPFLTASAEVSSTAFTLPMNACTSMTCFSPSGSICSSHGAHGRVRADGWVLSGAGDERAPSAAVFRLPFGCHDAARAVGVGDPLVAVFAGPEVFTWAESDVAPVAEGLHSVVASA